MKTLDHPLTWKTTCFLQGGCGKPVFAHTNGFGDFVLLDRLGQPWPIHECYLNRFENLAETRSVIPDLEPSDLWDSVKEMKADTRTGQKRFDVVGTITHVELGFVGSSSEFANLTAAAKAEVRKSLATRRSLLTVVSGDGEEFVAFFDSNADEVRFRDIVACTIKPTAMFNKDVFVVTSIRVFESGGDQ